MATPANADPAADGYIPTAAMGQRHAQNVWEAMNDKTNPERAREVREEVNATCSTSKADGTFMVAMLFTEDAAGETVLKSPGRGATPSLGKKQTGTVPARLFAVPLHAKSPIGGYEPGRITKSERALNEIYTEDMHAEQRQQFAMSYLLAICSAPR